jgi:hypothetical protein
MMPVQKPKFGQVQFLVILEWTAQALPDQIKQRRIIVTLAPGSIRSSDPDPGMCHPLDTQRDARPDWDLFNLYLRAIKE